MSYRVRCLTLPALLFAGLAVITGCHDSAPSAPASRRSPERADRADGSTRADRSPSTQPTTLTGTLSSGAVAVGGETTGWRLIGDGATGGIDVDVSKVKTRIKSLDGKRVTVTGRMTSRSWPERGDTPVLVADSVEATPPPKDGAAPAGAAPGR